MNKGCGCEHTIVAPSRRSFLGGLACAAISPISVRAQTGDSTDVCFMRMAIDEARQADFPFGAVIVRDGAVIARGRNLGRTTGDPTAHGEMVAIRRCLADRGSAALRGSTLYTSGEPCAMCMGAILWCHLGRVVFAASIAQLATKIDQIMISSAEIAAKAPFADRDHRRRAGGRSHGAVCEMTARLLRSGHARTWSGIHIS
jgi:tRNA(adenine34) deaminase